MSEHNDGGPAFPRPVSERWEEEEWQADAAQDGMTLWDFYAGQALVGMVAHNSNPPSVNLVAMDCADFADAMLAVRAERRRGTE